MIMRKLNILFVAALMVLMMACQTTTTADRIAELEAQLQKSGGVMTQELGEELVSNYCGYATNNPTDSLSPEYLFKALDVSLNLNNPQRTISIADRLRKEFPQYSKTPLAMFLKGFVYETQYGNTEAARKAYEEFIQIYPDSEFVGDAKASIENLGMTPEELIRKFEQQNAE